MKLMLINTQISSYLVPRSLWENGYQGIAPLALPVRDAMDIERRLRKEVLLHNEARRYAICCRRLQGMVREMAFKGAPIKHVHVWASYEKADEGNPRAVAYLAAVQYLQRFYQPARSGEKNLKYDRLEAVFHPPGQRLYAHLQLLAKTQSEGRLAEMCEYAVRKADVLSGGFAISAVECEMAIRQRYKLVAMAVEEDCGLVDVLEFV